MIFLLFILYCIKCELFIFNAIKDTYIHTNDRLSSINEGGNSILEVSQNSHTLISFDHISEIDRKYISSVVLRIPVHNVGPSRFIGVVNLLHKDFVEGNGMRFHSSKIQQDIHDGVTYDNFKPLMYRDTQNHPGSIFDIPNHIHGYVNITMTYLFKKTAIFNNDKNIGFIIRKFDSIQNDGFLRLMSKENPIGMNFQLHVDVDVAEVETPEHEDTYVADDGRGMIYDRNIIRTIYINTTNPDEWDMMNANSNAYAEGTIGAQITTIIDGNVMSGSMNIAGGYDERSYCTAYGAGGALKPEYCRKFSILVNHTVPYRGVKIMRLHGEIFLYKALYPAQGLTIENGDKANYISQMASLSLRYGYGMDLSQMANYVKVVMNGEYIGLFSNLEYQHHISFTKDRFWYGAYQGTGDMIVERGFFTPDTTDTDSNDNYWLEKTLHGEISTYQDFVKVGYDVEFKDSFEIADYVESTFETNDWHLEHISQLITRDWNQGPVHFYFGYHPAGWGPEPPPCMTFLDLAVSDQMYYNDTIKIRRFGDDVDMSFLRVMDEIFYYRPWYVEPLNNDCSGTTITSSINFPFLNGNSICQVDTQCFTMGSVWKTHFYTDYAIKGLDVIDKVCGDDQIDQLVDRLIDLVYDLAIDEVSLGGTSMEDLTNPTTGTWKMIRDRMIANIAGAKTHFESILSVY